MTDYLILECPNCENFIQIYKKDINCKIFRHAVYKHNGESIDPHSSKEIIEEFKEKEIIYGCGIPLKYIDNKLIVCGYI